MEGPPLGPGGEDITWPDQVAPRGRKASSTRKIKPQTSNLKKGRGRGKGKRKEEEEKKEEPEDDGNDRKRKKLMAAEVENVIESLNCFVQRP